MTTAVDIKKLPAAVRAQLVFTEPKVKKPQTIRDQVLTCLYQGRDQSVNDIIIAMWTKFERVVERSNIFATLSNLRTQGKIIKTDGGWRLSRAVANAATEKKAKRSYTRRQKPQDTVSAPREAQVYVTPPQAEQPAVNSSDAAAA